MLSIVNQSFICIYNLSNKTVFPFIDILITAKPKSAASFLHVKNEWSIGKPIIEKISSKFSFNGYAFLFATYFHKG